MSATMPAEIPLNGIHAAEPVLDLRNIGAGYGTVEVLFDVSLTVRKGALTALIGPNGAGKTTALKVAAGQLRPTAGTVHLGGDDITKSSSHRRAVSGLCHIPEGKGVYRNLTVRENLAMQSPKKRAAEAIERGTSVFPILGQRLSQLAGTLSGGEQQMLALCAAYVRQPDLVLVDEPSLGLAPIIVDEVFQFLATVRDTGTAVLLVDQYATRALAIADDVYVLRRGKIVHSGAASSLLDDNLFERYIGDGMS